MIDKVKLKVKKLYTTENLPLFYCLKSDHQEILLAGCHHFSGDHCRERFLTEMQEIDSQAKKYRGNIKQLITAERTENR